jgi:hypothetical protein
MTKEFEFSELPEKLKSEAIENHRDDHVDPDWYSPITEGFKEDMDAIGVETDDVSFTGFYSQGDGASFTGKVSDTDKFFELATVTIGGETYPIGDAPSLPVRISEIKGLKEGIGEINDPFDSYAYDINFNRNSHRYVHENTCETDVDIDWDEEDTLSEDGWFFYISRFGEADGVGLNFNTQVFFEALSGVIENWRVTTCKKLYRDLEEYWEDLNSDESIQDYIESNDIRFECEVDEDGTPAKIVGYLY